MVFFLLFFEEQQQTRPDSRWQLKVKLIGKGPAEFHLYTTGF
jgi:hypothetical protein